jgi:tetratricopeptide (TPR) repeat protein
MPKMKQKPTNFALCIGRAFISGNGQIGNRLLFVLFSLLIFSACGHDQEQTAVSLYWAGVRESQATNYAAAVANYTRAIDLFVQQHDESNRTNAMAYNNRGFTRDKLNDHTGALADLDEAIRLDSKRSPFHYNRGCVRFSQNDCTGALADFNQAVNLDPKFVPPLITRGVVERAMNDLTAATTDFQKVAELEPSRGLGYAGLAYVQSDRRQWPEALTNFHKALQLDSSSTDLPFQIWLIRTRLGETNAATPELVDLVKSHASVQRDKKFGEVLLPFLTGDLPETEFLRRAAALDGDADAQAKHRCAADYYAGMKRLLAGDRAAAEDFFQKCLATGNKHQINYGSARAELHALNQ